MSVVIQYSDDSDRNSCRLSDVNMVSEEGNDMSPYNMPATLSFYV